MARPSKKKKAPELVVSGATLTLRPLMEIREDTPQYYVNHAEVNVTTHEMTISFGRLPARFNSDDMQRLKDNDQIMMYADVQILVPFSLVMGLSQAIATMHDIHQKQLSGVDVAPAKDKTDE